MKGFLIFTDKHREKFKYFQKNIEEKMNKILFLQKRKTIPLYNLNNVLGKKYQIRRNIFIRYR